MTRLQAERDELVAKIGEDGIRYPWFAEPGHFYSPLVGEMPDVVFGAMSAIPEVETAGIDYRLEAQLRTLADLSAFFGEYPYADGQSDQRFWPANDQLGTTDASILHAMLRHLQPARVIEVGSGWSSALMLDLNDRLSKKMHLTFIEPYPTRLRAAFREGDAERCEVIEQPVQTVDLTVFDALEAGDVLFIDNSHVSKSGSDVNFCMFEILPRLKPGVVVHIHDMFYPFEYPELWVEQRRNWNEVFVVRAFLQFNEAFEMFFWENYLDATQDGVVLNALPQHSGFAGSLWIRRR